MKKVIEFLVTALAFSLVFTAVIFAAPKEYDTNGDGTVSLLDVVRALNAAASDTYSSDADVNGDGEVTVADVIAVLKCIVNGEGGSVVTYYSYIDIAERLTDTEWLAQSGNGEKTAEFTSYNRTSVYEDGEYVGWSANKDNDGYLSDTEDGGQLIADISGAGYISRIWSATVASGLVNVYIDGNEDPVISLSFEDYFNCTEEPFVYENLCYNDAAEGKNCFVPITFAESCRVVAYGGYYDEDTNTEGWGQYYNISYTVFPEGTEVEPMPSELSAEQKAALAKANDFIGESIGTNPEGHLDAEFETFTVTKDKPAVKKLDGKGAISGLLVRVDSLTDTYATSYEAVSALKDLRIKIWWDGEEEPSVNTPLGDFFASGYGYDKVKTLTLGVRDDRTLYNYFYMPYLRGAVIEISNVGNTAATVSLSVNVVENTVKDSDMLYFAAQFNLGGYHEDDTRWPDYNFLTVNGEGRLVGLTLHLSKKIYAQDTSRQSGIYWWGEGDEKFFIDGEEFPSWYGTGSEDFFGYAWCNSALYTKAFHAQSYISGGVHGLGNRVETRLFIGDSIAFEDSFDGYLEKYYSDDYVRYGFTSHFYRASDSTLENVVYDSTAVLDYYEPSDNYSITEGENMYVESINGSNGSVTAQSITTYAPSWSNNMHVLVRGLTEGESVDFTLPAPSDGEYMLLASLSGAKDYGAVQLAVNGEAVGEPIDTYAPSLVATTLSEIGKVTVTGGYTNTLTFTVTGKNTSSSNYYFAIDFVVLVSADKYTTLAEFDLSEYTDVKRLGTKASAVSDPLVWEGEDEMLSNTTISAATFRMQDMTTYGDTWSGGKQLFWYNTGTAGATLTTYIWVPEAGIYALSGGYTTAKDYAIFSLAVNGVKVGEDVDCYNTSVAHRVVEHGTVSLNAGYNKLVYTAVGKNSASLRYVFGVDYLMAEKLEVFEGEGEILTNAVVTAGSAPRIQTMTTYGTAWSGNQQLYWNNPDGLDAMLTTTITVSEAGEYIISGGYTTATDYGIFELYVNGEKVGSTVDCDSASVGHIFATHGTATLAKGENELVFKMVGSSGDLVRYRLGIDCICLQKAD